MSKPKTTQWRQKLLFIDRDAPPPMAPTVSPFPKWHDRYEQDDPRIKRKERITPRMGLVYYNYWSDPIDPEGWTDVYWFPQHPEYSWAFKKISGANLYEVWKPEALEPQPGRSTANDTAIRDMLKNIDQQQFDDGLAIKASKKGAA